MVESWLVVLIRVFEKQSQLQCVHACKDLLYPEVFSVLSLLKSFFPCYMISLDPEGEDGVDGPLGRTLHINFLSMLWLAVNHYGSHYLPQ